MRYFYIFLGALLLFFSTENFTEEASFMMRGITYFSFSFILSFSVMAMDLHDERKQIKRN